MNIYQKLIEVRKVVPYLQKEAKGAQYNYVGSSQVLANVRDKMDELQLLLIPAVTSYNVRESSIEQFSDKDTIHPWKRTTTYFTELEMTMTWVNAENPEEKIVCPWYGQGVDIAGEKGVGKALTYAEKYFILKQFNIPTDKDDPDSFQEKHDVKEKTRDNTPPRTTPAPTRPEPLKQNLKNDPTLKTTNDGDAELSKLVGQLSNDMRDKLESLQAQLMMANEKQFVISINAWIERAAKSSGGAFEPFEIANLDDLAKVDETLVNKLIAALTNKAQKMKVGA